MCSTRQLVREVCSCYPEDFVTWHTADVTTNRVFFEEVMFQLKVCQHFLDRYRTNKLSIANLVSRSTCLCLYQSLCTFVDQALSNASVFDLDVPSRTKNMFDPVVIRYWCSSMYSGRICFVINSSTICI